MTTYEILRETISDEEFNRLVANAAKEEKKELPSWETLSKRAELEDKKKSDSGNLALKHVQTEGTWEELADLGKVPNKNTYSYDQLIDSIKTEDKVMRDKIVNAWVSDLANRTEYLKADGYTGEREEVKNNTKRNARWFLDNPKNVDRRNSSLILGILEAYDGSTAKLTKTLADYYDTDHGKKKSGKRK